MKNRINKYLLLLGMLLMVCTNHYAAHAGSSSVKDAGKEVVSQNEIHKQITSINSYTSAVFKKAEDRFTTNESSEEEVSSSAKKIIKNTGALNAIFKARFIPLHFEPIHKKRSAFYDKVTSSASCRLHILFRVIRL
jgi:hypothetical protein